MQGSRDVWRRNDDRKRTLARVRVGIETSCLDPLQVDSIGGPDKIKAVWNLDGLGWIGHENRS